MNPGLLFTDTSTVTYSASYASPSFPVSNLYDYNPDTRWVSTTSASYQNVFVFFDGDTLCDTIVVDNHNMDSVMTLGHIELQYGDDPSFGTGLGTVGYLEPSSSEAYSLTFTPTTKQYWRILFNGTCNDVPYVGNIFLGKRVEMTSPYNWGYKKDNYEYNTSAKVNLAGATVSSQTSTGVAVTEVTFQYQTEATRQEWIEFIDTIRGRLYPFYFVDHEGVTRYVRLDTDYSPVMATRYGLYDLQNLRFRSIRPSGAGAVVYIIFRIMEDEWITGVS